MHIFIDIDLHSLPRGPDRKKTLNISNTHILVSKYYFSLKGTKFLGENVWFQPCGMGSIPEFDIVLYQKGRHAQKNEEKW